MLCESFTCPLCLRECKQGDGSSAKTSLNIMADGWIPHLVKAIKKGHTAIQDLYIYWECPDCGEIVFFYEGRGWGVERRRSNEEDWKKFYSLVRQRKIKHQSIVSG